MISSWHALLCCPPTACSPGQPTFADILVVLQLLLKSWTSLLTNRPARTLARLLLRHPLSPCMLRLPLARQRTSEHAARVCASLSCVQLSAGSLSEQQEEPQEAATRVARCRGRRRCAALWPTRPGLTRCSGHGPASRAEAAQSDTTTSATTTDREHLVPQDQDRRGAV